MQTPQKNAPQSARRSTKQHGPKSEVQKSVQSDNDAYLISGQEGDQTPSRKNRKPRKKSNARKNGVQSDIGEVNEYHGQRHVSHADKHKHTPARAIKSDAYAGPTFHQSPAASALPPPSFLSRSMPNGGPIGTIAENADSSPDNKKQVAKELEEKRESTPLDWMFEAARQGANTPNALKTQVVSPPAESPASRKEESDFPFELEGTGDDKSVYSTPLSQRFAASRTPQSISVGGQPLSDAERKAKTDALKKAIFNSPGSGEPEPEYAFNESNPFNAKNAPVNPPFPPHHTSNPATPTYTNNYGPGQNNYFQYGPNSPSRNYNYQQARPPSSNLRNVYDPGFGAPLSPPNTVQDQRISTARSPQPARALNFGAIYGGSVSRPQSEGNPAGHNSKPSLEQGLDDLKKALNMNLLT